MEEKSTSNDTVNLPKTLMYNMHDFLNAHNLWHKKIALGFSGGPDSLYLLHHLAPFHQSQKISLLAVHIDHEWRKDSFKDTQFCAEQAATLSVPFISFAASSVPFTKKYNGSLEEKGRFLRRTVFEDLLNRKEVEFIALAHHFDDQQETFFIRMLRGAGISGLSCMRPINQQYIRPLLNLSKQEIIAYLLQKKIRYITDTTNDSPLFLRNRIRKKIIPALKDIDTRFDKSFKTMLEHIQLVDTFIQKEVNALLILYKNQKNRFSIQDFFTLPDPFRYDFLIKLLVYHKNPFTPSKGLIKEIERFLKNTAQQGSHTLYNQWYLCKKNGFMWIEKQ